MREWLIANRPLIYFVYGQVFFVTGLAILLQTRRNSRLKLARSLRWLAGFSLTHGLHEWGELFIPIQAEFLSAPVINSLEILDILLLAASFVFLFQFGLELFSPFPVRWQWFSYASIGMLFLWLNSVFFFQLLYVNDVQIQHNAMSALARYLLGFPGAMVAAYGLRYHAKKHIAPINIPHIYKTLRIAGLALGAYALFGGLLVPAAPFFPADILNVDTFTRIFVFPPPVFRSLAGLVLAVTIIRALEVFEVETERLIERMEQAQVLAVERDRIARELHDGAIQQVYTAGLLAEALRKQSEGKTVEKLDRLIMTLNQAISDMRQFLTTLKPKEELIDPVEALSPLVKEVKQASDINLIWNKGVLPKLPTGTVTHLVAFTREALSNAVRHSGASQIEIRLEGGEGSLSLKVLDNGRGIPVRVQKGYGLRNMRDRARLLGGDMQLSSNSEKGTTVQLDIPLEKKE